MPPFIIFAFICYIYIVKLQKESERLDKILANYGFGTRKEVKKIIHSGAVTVNGEVQKIDDLHIKLKEDEICVDGEKLEIPQDAYFIINKPAGYVCSMVSDSHPVLFELLKDEDKNKKYPSGNLSMVGRLDCDTEGLLIITSDGDMNHKLTSPKWQIEKEYLVFLRDKLDEKTRKYYEDELSKGIILPAEGKHEEEQAKPCKIIWQDETKYESKPEAVCHIILTEGKFHEVKRIFMAFGNEVVYLKRIRMNKLLLGNDLKSGEYRPLTEEEKSNLL